MYFKSNKYCFIILVYMWTKVFPAFKFAFTWQKSAWDISQSSEERQEKTEGAFKVEQSEYIGNIGNRKDENKQYMNMQQKTTQKTLKSRWGTRTPLKTGSEPRHSRRVNSSEVNIHKMFMVYVKTWRLWKENIENSSNFMLCSFQALVS